MRQGAARRLAACVACAPARPTWVGAKLAFSLFPQFLLPPALENWNGLVFLFCLAWFFRFCFLACLSWWFFKFFADSGQVFGGVCLRRFKTVLDTLRHSSQLPLPGLANLLKDYYILVLCQFGWSLLAAGSLPSLIILKCFSIPSAVALRQAGNHIFQ